MRASRGPVQKVCKIQTQLQKREKNCETGKGLNFLKESLRYTAHSEDKSPYCLGSSIPLSPSRANREIIAAKEDGKLTLKLRINS